MSDVINLSMPDYFPQDEIDQQPVSYHGAMENLTKNFDGVEVELSISSRAGTFLTFRGLSFKDGYLCLSVDGDRINEVTHLILKGNSAL